MRLFSLLLLAASTSVALAQPPVPNGKTPEEEITNDLNAFVSGLNGNNPYFETVAYMSGAKIGYYGGPEWGDKWAKERGSVSLKLEKIEFFEHTGDDAKVRVSYRWKALFFRSELIQENLILHHAKTPILGKTPWQLVPLPPSEASVGVPAPDASAPFLNSAVGAMLTPEPIVTVSVAIEAQSHLKQLALGTLQFVQDYDETYAFLPQYAEKALAPYLKSETVWRVPGQSTKFTFNPELSAKRLAAVNEVARTVLFYEGEDEKPIFRYDGKAAIAFTDGHAALVSPEEIKNVFWKP